MAPATFVLVDTDVFIWLTRGTAAKSAKYAPHVAHKRIVLSFATVAELWQGAYERGDNETSRGRLQADIGLAVVVPPNRDITDQFARLRADAKASGHALGQRAQVHDAWIAATALSLSLPLLTDDKHFDA